VTPIGHCNRVTQIRIVTLIRDELNYRYFGDWSARDGNSAIDARMRPA